MPSTSLPADKFLQRTLGSRSQPQAGHVDSGMSEPSGTTKEELMHTDAAAEALSKITRPASYRWMRLVMGIVCMAMIANLQYGWTLFVNPIADKYGWSKAEIQAAFTIFVLTETWLVPIEGYLLGRFGPRPVVFIGGLLCGIGWGMNSFADSLVLLYVP